MKSKVRGRRRVNLVVSSDRQEFRQVDSLRIVRGNLNDSQHQLVIVTLLDAYSADPMGDGHPLAEFAKQHLIVGLREHPTSLVFLAFHGCEPCGIAICFRGFSTFAARPLINISDFYVDPTFRGRGVGTMLLYEVEREARTTGCCKLTLEVQQNNSRARMLYGKFGFAHAVYAADANTGGGSTYMLKPI